MRRLVVAFASITLAEWVLGTIVAVHAYAVGAALAVGLIGFRFAPAALAGHAINASFRSSRFRDK